MISGRSSPTIPSSEKTALSLVQGSGLLSWKPKWSVDGIEVLPTIPTDFARAKGWCLNKTLPLVLLLVFSHQHSECLGDSLEGNGQ